MADMKILRSKVVNMCADLVASVGIPFESTTELQRQVLASFAFGMIFAMGQVEHLTPPDVHALSITMLIDAFKYSPEQAGAFSSHLIESSRGNGNPTIQAIVHRGIDGHLQWSSGQTVELRENINSALQAVGALARSADVGPLLCRFLDAGNDETALALRRPASKKRQGTKSREVWRGQGSERYGDCM